MRTLSFDTSTSTLYACLADGELVLAEEILICNPDDRQFAASLIMPTLANLLAKAGFQKQDIELIAIGIGPGSFTGIRVATVAARTLCQALNLPLLGINRFQCYAFKEQIRSFPSLMVLSAGKKQYFCAHLDSADFANWQGKTYHLSAENLFDHMQGFENIYAEQSITLNPESPAKHWHPLPQLNNIAKVQTQLAATITKSQPFDPAQFSYKQVTPLYVQNASVTVKSTN